MDCLFNDISYPIVTSEEAIAEELTKSTARAVILRSDNAWQQEAEIFRRGITMGDNPGLGQLYHHDPQEEHGRKKAGARSYTDVIAATDILRETNAADIMINAEACSLFQDKVNGLRALYQRINKEFFGPSEDESLVGRLMFTPKHGLGRSPMMHVDNVGLTLHATFAGATLRLLTGITSDTLWDAMNVKKVKALSPEECDANNRKLSILTEQYNEEFSDAPLGDAIIMKGQRDRDLDDPAVRESVCVHASSPYIPNRGQAGVLFYTKKTLDMP